MNTKTNKGSAAQAGVLAEFVRLREVLAGTHSEIPQLLARERTLSRVLGLNDTEELRRQLADLVAERESAIRRRTATIAAIVELEGPLQGERESVEAQRHAYAATASAEFETRYKAAVSVLQALWAEGRLLAETLKVPVSMPLPVRIQISPVDSVPRAVPILADVHVAVDAEAAKLGTKLDKLDEALGLIGAVQQAKELDVRHRALSQQRTGMPTRMEGLFEVTKAFSYYGMEFAPGTILDRTMLNDGCLNRFLMGRNIRVLDDRPAAA